MIKNGSDWACWDAITVLPASETGSGKWLQARREGIGSSEAAVLMGEGLGDASPYTIWLDKLGKLDDDPRTPQMEWGLRAEDAAARWFADATGLTLRRKGLLQHRGYCRLQATVDRLTSDGGLLEVKVSETGAAYAYRKQLRRGEMPRHWYWQLVHQMLVSGRSPGWLAAVVGGELFIDHVSEQQAGADAGHLVEVAGKFWEEHVATGSAPEQPAFLELGEDGLVVDADPDLADLLHRWAAAKARLGQNGIYLETLRELVLDAVGRASMVKVDGRPFLRRRVVVADRVDVSALRRDDPATAARFLTTAAHVRLELID